MAVRFPWRNTPRWQPPARERLPSDALSRARFSASLQPKPEVAPGEGVRTPELALLEACLFLADEPVSLRKLCQACELATDRVRLLLEQLQEYYRRDSSAFEIVEIAGGYQLLTRPALHPWLSRHQHVQAELKLSASARETLAIIAYRQPIMRTDIEAIRGVQSAEVLRVLMEKGLVRIVGRHDSLGRPVLYGTTKKFMQVFALNSLKDLPEIEPAPAKEPAPTKSKGKRKEKGS